MAQTTIAIAKMSHAPLYLLVTSFVRFC